VSTETAGPPSPASPASPVAEGPASPATAPVLGDGVVTLRAHTLADVDAILEQCLDPSSRRFTTVPREYTRDDAVAFVERGRAAWAEPDGVRSWAVEWVDDDGTARFGGTVDLRPGAAATAGELGFGLHPDARGRGLMSRAVRLVCEHAFATDGQGGWGEPLHRIHWRAIVGNWASRRTAWACGFTMHATLPESHPDPEGSPRALDTWMASIVAGDPLHPAAPWWVPPVLEGDGVRLRPWRPTDIEAIEPRDADPVHWMPPGSVLRPEMFAAWHERRLELMASGCAVEWCVADPASDRALGGVVLFNRGGPVADVAELGRQGRGSPRDHARQDPARRRWTRPAPAHGRDRCRQRGEQLRPAGQRVHARGSRARRRRPPGRLVGRRPALGARARTRLTQWSQGSLGVWSGWTRVAPGGRGVGLWCQRARRSVAPGTKETPWLSVSR
jgi:RimJ/RimL family protein N-acetyltransferase